MGSLPSRRRSQAEDCSLPVRNQSTRRSSRPPAADRILLSSTVRPTVRDRRRALRERACALHSATLADAASRRSSWAGRADLCPAENQFLVSSLFSSGRRRASRQSRPAYTLPADVPCNSATQGL